MDAFPTCFKKGSYLHHVSFGLSQFLPMKNAVRWKVDSSRTENQRKKCGTLWN